MDSKGKSRIRTLFIVLLLFLPLQYGLVGIIGELHSEPWPAFVFPGFKSVYSTGTGVEIEQHLFRVYSADGEMIQEMRPQELFPDLPLSQIPGFMRTHFHDPTSVDHFSEKAVEWVYQKAEQFSDGGADHLEIVIRNNSYLRSEDGLTFDSVLSEELIPIQRIEYE